MKKILYPILAVIVFIIMQAVVGVAVFAVAALQDPELLKKLAQTGDQNALMGAVGTGSLAWAIIISGMVTVAIISLLKMIDWKHAFDFKMIDWKWCWLAVAGAALGIFALDVFEEMLDLPNLMEDTFMDMSNSLIGALSIAIIGPIIEELIFREGILGYMLRNDVNKWVAITASALAFGIIHLNPAQVPFAAAMGFILGIIYYKTGNIVITSILHILNNSLAVWTMFSMGEAAKDYSLVEDLGGPALANGICIPVLVVCIGMLISFWKKSATRNES